jgi:hypothetical protein
MKQSIAVSFTLHKAMQRAQELLVMDVVAGARYYIGINVVCEKKQYGISHDQVEKENVPGIGNIPKVLIHLRTTLEKHKGYESQGIFRLNGNDTVMKRMKKEVYKQFVFVLTITAEC